MSEVFDGFKYYITLECRIGDFSQHEDGIRISFYDREEERPVDGQPQRDALFLDLVLKLRTFF